MKRGYQAACPTSGDAPMASGAATGRRPRGPGGSDFPGRIVEALQPAKQRTPKRCLGAWTSGHADMSSLGLVQDRAGDQVRERTRGSRRDDAVAPGTATNVGAVIAEGSTARPAIRHSPRAGALSPYHPDRQARATSAASGTPSFSQSSSATNSRARAPSCRHAREASILRGDAPGISQSEQRLQHIDRQGLAERQCGLQQR